MNLICHCDTLSLWRSETTEESLFYWDTSLRSVWQRAACVPLVIARKQSWRSNPSYLSGLPWLDFVSLSMTLLFVILSKAKYLKIKHKIQKEIFRYTLCAFCSKWQSGWIASAKASQWHECGNPKFAVQKKNNSFLYNANFLETESSILKTHIFGLCFLKTIDKQIQTKQREWLVYKNFQILWP